MHEADAVDESPIIGDRKSPNVFEAGKTWFDATALVVGDHIWGDLAVPVSGHDGLGTHSGDDGS